MEDFKIGISERKKAWWKKEIKSIVLREKNELECLERPFRRFQNPIKGTKPKLNDLMTPYK